MSKRTPRALPIRSIRESKGFSLDYVAEHISALLGRPISADYVQLLEYRGTITYDYIKAFAKVYSEKDDDIAIAFRKRPD